MERDAMGQAATGESAGKTAKHVGITEEQFDKKGFWALVVTQFQGAFNDNLFQFLLIPFLVLYYASATPEGTSLLGIDLSRNVENFASFLFSMPFIIFPAFFGALSDRFSKQRIALFTKFWEIAIMCLGGLAFFLGYPPFLWIVLFLMATQSAMFGPSKYGIMPEIMPESRLSWGNGIVQMTTIVAIIMGVALAGPLYGYVRTNFDGNIHYASVVLVGLSVIGMLFATRITRPPAANPQVRVRFNPILIWSGMGPHFRVIWNDKVLLSVVFGYLYFWFAGVLIRNNVLSFALRNLGVGEDKATLFVAALTIGIGIGALIAGFLSRQKIELGLVPLGAAGIAFFSMLLAIPATVYLGAFGIEHEAGTAVPGFYFAFVMMAAMFLGLSAGIFDVPLAASIQHRAPNRMKGGVIAAVNMMSFVGITTASLLLIALNQIGFTEHGIFAVCSILTLMVGFMITWRLPHLIVRSGLWILANTLYRVRTLGRDRVPEKGGALIVANHLSMVDCLALIASTDRVIRFVVGKEVLDRGGWMARLAKISKAITYDPDDPASVARAIGEAREAVASGTVVCITTETAHNGDGERVADLDDIARYLDGVDAPVVPVHLDRLWGRLYTFEDGKLRIKWPPSIPYVIQVTYGDELGSETPMWQVRQAIEKLGVHSYMERPLPYKLLHRGFVRSARRNLRKRAVVDLVSGELSFFKTLVGSIVFARKLKGLLVKEPMVGVLLPPSVGGVLTNVALQMMGRVPVNLNYTASPAVLDSCAKQCGFTQVLTSRKFMDRLPNAHVPGEAIYVDDIKETVKGSDRIVGMLLGLFAPVSLIEKLLGSPKRTAEDLATIVFSSGSEGEPKGVMLSHRNIIANVTQGLETFPHNRETSLVGYLPFFHSFGFMATLWMPITSGLHALYHPNPLEPKIIGELIEKHRGTIMIGTSTFLQHFIRRCTPEQLSSLDFVVTGAEKLAPRVRLAFKEKFGVEPLEGYGTTECAPAVSVNIPDLVSPGFRHVGTRHGTIGRPMPGQAVRVEDPDTGVELTPNEPGLLWVKGPNIMQGYLHLEEKTAEVLQDGWYATGDIAAVSEDRFITITDRLARFSKIAGEMVPHTKVEETLHQVLDLTDQSMAVASVPDQQKGERLVVLHTLEDAKLDELLGKLDKCGLPNLWIPRASAFYRVDEIPVMATGKMDIKAVKKMAQDFDLGD